MLANRAMGGFYCSKRTHRLLQGEARHAGISVQEVIRRLVVTGLRRRGYENLGRIDIQFVRHPKPLPRKKDVPGRGERRIA